MNDLTNQVMSSLREILLNNEDVYEGMKYSVLSVFIELGEIGMRDICPDTLATKIVDRIIGKE